MNVFNCICVRTSERSETQLYFDANNGAISKVCGYDSGTKHVSAKLSIVEQSNPMHNVMISGELNSHDLEVDFGDVTNPTTNYVATGIVTVWTNNHMVSTQVFVPKESRRAVATALCAPKQILNVI